MEDVGASLGVPPPVPGSAPPGGAEEQYKITIGRTAAASSLIRGSRADSPPPYLPPVAPAAVTTVTTTPSDLTSTTMSNIAISSTGTRFTILILYFFHTDCYPCSVQFRTTCVKLSNYRCAQQCIIEYSRCVIRVKFYILHKIYSS